MIYQPALPDDNFFLYLMRLTSFDYAMQALLNEIESRTVRITIARWRIEK